MKARTSNQNSPLYKYYGGRGISMKKEWFNSFQVFYDWAMANGYEDSLTIDRINNEGNYEPSNCRWVDMKIQSTNKRSNFYIKHNKEVKTLTEWSKKTKIPHSSLSYRLRHQGLTIGQAIKASTRDTQNQKKLDLIKQCLQSNPHISIRQIAKKTGISKSAVQRLLKKI